MSEEKLKMQLAAIENTNYTDCLEEGLQIIVDEAKNIVHVVTGNLRDSIHLEKTSDSVNIQADADYAGIEEYGDDTREGHPYLRPALETKSAEAAEKIAKSVEERIKEVIK